MSTEKWRLSKAERLALRNQTVSKRAPSRGGLRKDGRPFSEQQALDVAGITYFDAHGWGLSPTTCQALFCVRLWRLSACLHVAGLWCITLVGRGDMKHHRSVLQVMSRGAQRKRTEL